MNSNLRSYIRVPASIESYLIFDWLFSCLEYYHLHVLKPVQNMCFSLLAARALWVWMLLSCSSLDATAVRMMWPRLHNPHCRTIVWVGGTAVYRLPT